MYTGDWHGRSCPKCTGGEGVKRVRANAAAFTCPACGHEWSVRRMPTDAEAAAIVKGPRTTPGPVAEAFAAEFAEAAPADA